MERSPLFDETKIKAHLSSLYESVTVFFNDFVNNIADKENVLGYHSRFVQFSNDHKARTTSEAERIRRITFLNNALIRDTK